jgi:predicted type IV restriction endonuclease
VLQSIEAIRNGLLGGRFTNEASVSQGIVLRLLSELSWPAYDTSVVWPEYALRGRRVDFALCHPPGKPIVFIEVKKVGQGADAERQLFEYAFHEGVPLAILTTGQEWHFFLPAERGDYGERRVYKLDLLEREPSESIERLKRYLEFGAIVSGVAVEAARVDYRSIAKEREIRRTLPDAWRKLIDEGDDLLVELLAEKVESLCGFRPDPETVWTFLSSTAAPQMPVTPICTQRRVESPVPVAAEPLIPDTQGLERFSLEVLGQHIRAENGRDVRHRLFVELDRRDPTFLERFASRSTSGRNKRPYLARSKDALYPGSEHIAGVASNCREVRPGSGWWLDLHLSYRSMERVALIACEVAGLSFGSNVKIRFG